MISTLYPLGGNYGGLIQAYALQQVVESFGFDVFTINSERRLTKVREYAQWIRHAVRRPLRSSSDPTPLTGKRLARHRAPVTDFVDNYLKTVDFFAMPRGQRRAFLGRLEAIIVGSDQVWRGGYANVQSQMLNYAQRYSMVKASYAASFGADRPIRLTKRVIRKSRPLIRGFSGVSVREESGVRLCMELWDVKAEHHVDPTLLLDKAAYVNLITRSATTAKEESPNLFAYLLDSTTSTESIVTRLSEELNLPVRRLYMDSRTSVVHQNSESPVSKMATLEAWLNSFYCADFVVTDSFHGTVFSIIFEKPFIALGNQARGLARFNSLLTMLGLGNRLVDMSNPEFPEDLRTIDWRTTRRRISAERERSIDYLKDVLCSP